MKKIYHLCAVLLSLFAVACATPDGGEISNATYLTVTPSRVSFKADQENLFTVDCDGDWIAITSEKILLSANSGRKGITPVQIVAVNGSDPQTITLRTPSNTTLVATVIVTPDGGGNEGGSYHCSCRFCDMICEK